MLASEPVPTSSAAPSDRSNGGLTERQLQAVDIVWEHQLSKSWKEIAGFIGVNVTTLWQWRQKPEFRAELIARSRGNLREYVPAAYRVLINNMLAGKEWAVTRFFEITGEYQEAGLRDLLGAWMVTLSVAGTENIRELLALVNQARPAGGGVGRGRDVVDAEHELIEAPGVPAAVEQEPEDPFEI